MADNTDSHSSFSDGLNMVGGHAQYVKGAVEQGIGSLTGSESWKESGIRDKEQGVETMRACHHEPSTDGRSKTVLNAEGSVEQTLGSAVGCRGMKHDGDVKKNAAI